MEVRTAAKAFLMPDAALLDPIYEWLGQNDATLIAHIGEPRACWEPLVPSNPHYHYYSTHQQMAFAWQARMAIP